MHEGGSFFDRFARNVLAKRSSKNIELFLHVYIQLEG
jgi:hypothetical protein